MFGSTDFCTQGSDTLGAGVEFSLDRMHPREMGFVPLVFEGSVDCLDLSEAAGVVTIWE